MGRLYDITNDFVKVQEMIESGEYDEAALKDTLESLEFDLEEKAENYAKIMKNLEADIAGLKLEEERLENKRKSLENKIEYLKKNLENAMITAKHLKFKTPLFSFNVQNNAPSLDIETEENIPKEFYKEQAPKLDRVALLKHIKEGTEIEGVSIKRTQSLRIK